MASEYTSKEMWICPECREDFETVDQAYNCCAENKDEDSLSKKCYEQKTVYRCTGCQKFSFTNPTHCPECAKIEKTKLDEWNLMVSELESKSQHVD